MRRHVSALLALLVLALAAAVQAQPTTKWAVRMAQGSRCTSDPAFLQHVIAQVPEAQRASVSEAELVAEIEIVDQIARIHVFDRVLQAEAGARELPLSARHCVDIADSVGLVLGVLVEAGRGALTSERELAREPEPEPEPEREPEPEKARPKQPPPRVRPAWRGPPAGHDLFVAAGAYLGLVQRPVLGFGLGWVVRPHKTWPFVLQGSGWYDAESQGKRGTVSAFHAGVHTCPLAETVRSVRLRACAGVTAGAMFAKSERLVRTMSDQRPLALAGIELAAHIPLTGPLELLLIARADAMLTRTRFYYTSAMGERVFLFDPSVVIGELLGGLSLRLR